MTPLRAPPMPRAQARPIVAGLAGGVLVDRQQARHAAAFFEFAADQVAGALGGDEQHVDVLRRHDRLEVDVEPVRHAERLAGLEVRRDATCCKPPAALRPAA